MRTLVRDASRSSVQRGAATLVVVMVLFLVMALLAAYANRSLMFEQRISGGYYRASLAQEMSEGGLDWAISMLNGTAVDGSCKPVNNGGTRFADLYLNVSTGDRKVQSVATDPSQLVADCVRTDDSTNPLVCRCQAANGRTTQPSTAGNGVLVPSLGIYLVGNTAKTYGSFDVDSRGCTDSSVDNCAGTTSLSQRATATARQKARLGFVSAVPSTPASALTVKGTLTTAGAGGLGLHNSDPQSTGTLVVSGGPEPILNDDRMDSVPGTDKRLARFFGDETLQDTQYDKNRMFRAFLGMEPIRYQNHPALRNPDCAAGACTGASLVSAVNAGKRILWVKGDLTIDTDVSIGSDNNPVLVIVDGNVTINGPMKLTGMLVVMGDLGWTNTGGLTSLITGNVLVTGDMVATGSMDIYYRQAVADQLRNRLGSFARVPGGWIDTTEF